MSFNEMTKQFKKAYGDDVGGEGYSYVNAPRLQTGWFPFDLATGGGMPEGRCVEIFGPESSGKTNLVLRLIAAKQKKDPHLKNAFFDIENSFDPVWAAKLGVDVDKLYVFDPDHGEDLVDMVEGLIHSQECGIIAVDSLAALVTVRELSQSANKLDVGGSAMVVQKLTRKAVKALSNAKKEGRFPTLIGINQIRFKIGVMFGDPEKTPGGEAFKFAAGMRIRLYGKNITDAKVDKVMPVIKKTSVILKKWKCPIVSPKCEYDMVAIPHNGMDVGEVSDWNSLSSYMQKHGLLEKGPKNKGWVMLEQPYPTLVACQQYLKDNPKEDYDVRQAIIEVEMQTAIEAQEDETKSVPKKTE